MGYLYGAAAGFAFGATVGGLKYILIWRRMIEGAKESGGADAKAQKTLMTSMMLSSFVNVATLLGIFFVRNMLPFDFSATIIAAAVGLSIFGRSFSMQKILKTDAKKNASGGKNNV